MSARVLSCPQDTLALWSSQSLALTILNTQEGKVRESQVQGQYGQISETLPQNKIQKGRIGLQFYHLALDRKKKKN